MVFHPTEFLLFPSVFVVLVTLFQNVLEWFVVVLEGREGCQNDPRETLHNPPGGMGRKNSRISGIRHLHWVLHMRRKFDAQIVCVVVVVFVTSFGMRRLAGL